MGTDVFPRIIALIDGWHCNVDSASYHAFWPTRDFAVTGALSSAWPVAAVVGEKLDWAHCLALEVGLRGGRAWWTAPNYRMWLWAGV